MPVYYTLAALFLWGSNVVVTKLSVGFLQPVEISFLRWLVASVILLPMSMLPLYKYRAVVKESLCKLACLGALGGVVYQSVAYVAAGRTTAMNMGLIQALMPSFTLMLSFFLWRAKVSRLTLISITIAFFGVVVALVGQAGTLATIAFNVGDLLMLGATLSMAAYNVLASKWSIKIPLVCSMFVQAVVASLILFPFYVATSSGGYSHQGAMIVGYSGVVASVLAPLCWLASIKFLGAAKSSMFYSLLPLIVMSFSVVLLKEQLTPMFVVGSVMVTVGVFLGARVAR